MSYGTHWAAPLIGRPYLRGAAGPDAFDCWGLVRHVFAVHHGIDMPVVNVASTEDQADAIRAAAQASGWRPVDAGIPRDGDIALMRGPLGRHVGVLVLADGHLRLLHSVERVGVCMQSLADVRSAGFSRPTLWRLADGR